MRKRVLRRRQNASTFTGRLIGKSYTIKYRYNTGRGAEGAAPAQGRVWSHASDIGGGARSL